MFPAAMLHIGEADLAWVASGAPDVYAVSEPHVRELARHPRVRAVGETGLDHFRTRDADGHRTQRDAFAWHIALAHATGKTLVIHDRDSHDDVLALLEERTAPARVVFHCFSGDADMARHCAEREVARSLG